MKKFLWKCHFSEHTHTHTAKHIWIRESWSHFAKVPFCFVNTAQYILSSMAVYIAIESHRLHFHLASSKQLNYTWKYKVNTIYVYGIYVVWIYVSLCMYIVHCWYVTVLLALQRVRRWSSPETKSKSKSNSGDECEKTLRIFILQSSLYSTLFSLVHRSCDNFQIERAFG